MRSHRVLPRNEYPMSFPPVPRQQQFAQRLFFADHLFEGSVPKTKGCCDHFAVELALCTVPISPELLPSASDRQPITDRHHQLVSSPMHRAHFALTPLPLDGAESLKPNFKANR